MNILRVLSGRCEMHGKDREYDEDMICAYLYFAYNINEILCVESSLPPGFCPVGAPHHGAFHRSARVPGGHQTQFVFPD
uniref:Uncharacterized protein n=1 Tax=Leersia perrieri TaxID=77586 RepID=A0A0D9X5U9_9ORYZ